MKQERMILIIDNYINGNLSDLKKQIKHLSKKQFLALLDFSREYIPLHAGEMESYLKNNL